MGTCGLTAPGATATSRRMRDAYRHSRPLSAARPTAHLNPGHVWVSTSAAEPTVVHGVRHDLLQPCPRQGQLQLLTGNRPVSADVDFDRLDAISVIDCRRDPYASAPGRVLDVSEERDLLPLTGCEHAVSGKSIDEAGQPRALPGRPDPHDQQAIIRCVTLELRPGSTGPRPVTSPLRWSAAPLRCGGLRNHPGRVRLNDRVADEQAARRRGPGARVAAATRDRNAGSGRKGHDVTPNWVSAVGLPGLRDCFPTATARSACSLELLSIMVSASD